VLPLGGLGHKRPALHVAPSHTCWLACMRNRPGVGFADRAIWPASNSDIAKIYANSFFAIAVLAGFNAVWFCRTLLASWYVIVGRSRSWESFPTGAGE